MEDLDPPRERPGAADEILRTLEAFGFEWDGEVIYQSRRHGAYDDALGHLLDRKLAYPCCCSRKEVAEFGLEGTEGPRYPGTCRTGMLHRRNVKTVRVRTDSRPVAFSDLIHGRVSQDLDREIGDFVIRRADGYYAYQLAVVVDDAFQEITHVVRGADLLSSTPRQIYLQGLLGLDTPAYLHLPLVLDRSGAKLSKQDGAHPVERRDPLPSLLSAYGFLNQPDMEERPGSVEEFWEMAAGSWDRSGVTAVVNHALP